MENSAFVGVGPNLSVALGQHHQDLLSGDQVLDLDEVLDLVEALNLDEVLDQDEDI